MTQNVEVTTETLIKLFGSLDENARLIEKGLGVSLRPRDGVLKITGDEQSVERATYLVNNLIALMGKGYDITREKVLSSIDLVLMDKPDDIISLSTDAVAVTARGKYIKCKTIGQRAYVSAIKKNTLVFGVGPAGTGKTYLAVAMAVASYKSGESEKIILTRPAIEAGEKLGFLPGDLQEKVDPYLRPLYDALQENFGVVNGDLTQADLPHGASGLKHAVEILKDIEGVDICYFTDKDIVRHELVQRIVLAYAAQEKNDNGKRD